MRDDTTPLAGRRILMLRPKGVSSKLEAQLQAWGAVVEPLTLTKTIALDEASVQQQFNAINLTAVDWVALTSQQGVAYGWHWIEPLLISAPIAVIGQATQHAVEARGGTVGFCAEKASGKGLAEGLLTHWAEIGIKTPQTVLWVGSALAGEGFFKPLVQAGHTVERVAVYTTQAIAFSVEEIRQLQGTIDAFAPWAVVVTSGSGVRALADLGLQVGVGCTLVSLGAGTTEAILAYEWGCGFVEADAPTPAGVLAVLREIM
jgi:uroporphyrinogen-III synthase